jgi:predicted dehydrogenase
MAQFKAGVIGCGGRGKAHARGWTISEDVDLVACSDPFEESRKPFMDTLGVAQGYTDYREMLEKEDLDFVSVCTWIRMHHDMIVDVAQSGVKTIHSEKPIAPTWGEAKSLYKMCVDNDVVITFCHQRRFGAQFVKAKQLLKSGAIGDLYRLEGNCPNLFDWGTHWFDMFFFYNDDIPAEWVMGQIDAQGGHEVFGVPVEGSGLSWIRYQNGVEGLLATGGTNVQGIQNRLVGTEGVIEVIGGRDQPPLRMFSKGEWTEPSVEGVVAHTDATVMSVLDLVDAVKGGREPELSGRKAMAGAELIFSTYESSRRRARVDLPLDVDDSALLTMLDEGTISMEIGK